MKLARFAGPPAIDEASIIYDVATPDAGALHCMVTVCAAMVTTRFRGALGQADAPPPGWPQGGVVAVPGAAGVGMACTVTGGGGAGASAPWLKFHVHDAVACVPAGCM